MNIDTVKIAQRAKSLRLANNIQTNGIKDIFSFVNSQSIELIRYPFGKDTILGFSTIFEGKKVIVSNSSEILSREIYTIAHELGHMEYDFKDNKYDLKISKETDKMSDDYSEQVAYEFADCLLMPKGKLGEFLEDTLNKTPEELNAINLVRMQLEFNVSFNALTRRLVQLGLITENKKKELRKERDSYTSRKLFELLGADDSLIKPSEIISVPPQYAEYVLSNYNNGYIPFKSLENAFNLLGIVTSDLKDDTPDYEDIDIENLFKEYD